MLLDYWGERRLNHHTEATSMLYAALECARILVAEGHARSDGPVRIRRRVFAQRQMGGSRGFEGNNASGKSSVADTLTVAGGVSRDSNWRKSA